LPSLRWSLFKVMLMFTNSLALFTVVNEKKKRKRSCR
jgi:hypothetical protein